MASQGMVRFSVVINNYNYRRFIADAIDGALNQTRKPLEIIVVDDGSTDGSVDFLKEEYASDIVLVESENRGQLHAMILGVGRASGDFVAFLDADDTWKPDHLEKAGDLIRRRPDIDFIVSNADYVGEASGIYSERERDRDIGHTRFAAWTRDWIGAPTSCLIVSRSHLDYLGRLPSSIVDAWKLRADDVLVFAGSVLGAHKYQFAKPTVRYRVHGGNGFIRNTVSAEEQARWRRSADALMDWLKASAGIGSVSEFAIAEFKENRLMKRKFKKALLKLALEEAKSPGRKAGLYFHFLRSLV